MNTGKFTTIIIVLFFLITSCSKDKEDNNTGNPINFDVSNFNEMDVSGQFDWNTSKGVNIHIEGLPTNQVVSNVLIIKSLDGKIYYKGLTRMDESKTIVLDIPATVKKLSVEFAAIQKEINITGNSADFSFIPEADNSDLD